LHGLGVDSPSSHGDVVGTNAFSHSSEWEFGLKVEWSVDMEAPSFVESLGLWSLGLVNIDDLPLLLLASVVSENSDCGSFFILSALDFNYLVVSPVDELAVLILEDLEPS
jgi:hypothetical protein